MTTNMAVRICCPANYVEHPSLVPRPCSTSLTSSVGPVLFRLAVYLCNDLYVIVMIAIEEYCCAGGDEWMVCLNRSTIAHPLCSSVCQTYSKHNDICLVLLQYTPCTGSLCKAPFKLVDVRHRRLAPRTSHAPVQCTHARNMSMTV